MSLLVLPRAVFSLVAKSAEARGWMTCSILGPFSGLVVTTLIRLKSNFTTRTLNSLGQLARGFLVFLRLVIHLERTSPAKNKRGRDPSVSRTSERLSTMHIGLQDHSPLMDLLPLDLCAGKGHLDDLACFRAQHITVAIITLHTKDGVFTRSACM